MSLIRFLNNLFISYEFVSHLCRRIACPFWLTSVNLSLAACRTLERSEASAEYAKRKNLNSTPSNRNIKNIRPRIEKTCFCITSPNVSSTVV
jgi:hypothetical protein